MKYSQWIGVGAAITLMASCLVNWTWYPDLQKYFTGFSSHNNIYGKPGKLFVVLAVIAIMFYVIPRVWAKRWNVLVCCVAVAFAVKTFILYAACYRGICPDKQPGLWIMLGSALLMLAAALLPDLKVNAEPAAEEPSNK